MAYPGSYDTLTTVVERGDSVSDALTLTASAVPFIVDTTYNILQTVYFNGIYSTEVLSTPGIGQFRVIYQTNQIELGPLAAPANLTVYYTTSGSKLTSSLINSLNTAVSSIQTTLGINPQAAEGTVAARIDALAAVSGLTAVSQDFTSILNGSTVLFNLSNVPVDEYHVEVRLNGLELRLNNDFQVAGTSVTLIEAPTAADTLVIRVFKSV